MPVPDVSRAYFVVLNRGSGPHADARERQRLIESTLRAAGARCEVRVAKGRSLAEVIARQAQSARAAGGVLVGAGGDGTLNAVAAAAHAQDLRFAALPQGTFNFFGRNLGLPEDLAAATRLLPDAEERPVQVGEVGDRIFLVNASLGLYQRLLQDREEVKRRYGRSRLVALWAGLGTLLRRHPRLRLRLLDERGERCEDVLTFVAGNNRLQLERLGLPGLERLEQGQLIGIRLPPQPRGALLRTALRGLGARWENSDTAVAFGFRELVVDPLSGRRRGLRVGIDGEIVRLPTPLRFRVSPRPLRMLLPRSDSADGDAT